MPAVSTHYELAERQPVSVFAVPSTFSAASALPRMPAPSANLIGLWFGELFLPTWTWFDFTSTRAVQLCVGTEISMLWSLSPFPRKRESRAGYRRFFCQRSPTLAEDGEKITRLCHQSEVLRRFSSRAFFSIRRDLCDLAFDPTVL